MALKGVMLTEYIGPLRLIKPDTRCSYQILSCHFLYKHVKSEHYLDNQLDWVTIKQNKLIVYSEAIKTIYIL